LGTNRKYRTKNRKRNFRNKGYGKEHGWRTEQKSHPKLERKELNQKGLKRGGN